MANVPRRGSARRNLFRLGGAILTIALVTVTATLINRAPRPILDEDPAVNRARRTAPDNAYPMLAAAATALPETPGPRVDREAHDFLYVPWCAAAESPARLVDSGIVEADPAFVAFMEAARAALGKALPALDKPYFLLHDTPFEIPSQRRPHMFQRLGAAFAALGAWQARTQNRFDEGRDTLLNTIKLSRLAAQDRGMHPEDPGAEGTALAVLRQLAMDTADAARLDALQAQVDALGVPYPSARPQIEQFWRTLDAILLQERSYEGIEARRRVATAYFLWHWQGLSDWTRENKDRLLMLADGRPLDQFAFIAGSNVAGSNFERNWGPVYAVWRIVRASAAVNSQYQGTRIAIALERYRRAHNAYPDTLEALAPLQLAEIPIDALSREPFVYTHTGETYKLFSCGDWLRHDNMDPQRAFYITGAP